MASLTFTLSNSCASNSHIIVEITGDKTGTLEFHRDDLLNDFTEDEKRVFIKGVLRMYKTGRTQNQVRTALQSGLTITF